MKLKGLLLGLAALFCMLPLTGQAGAAGNYSHLTVRITGVRDNHGVVRVAMFNSPKAFAEQGGSGAGAVNRAKLPIKNGQAVWEIPKLPYGVYGIKLFHDKDNSGQFKRSFIGEPQEGFGFSNNPAVHTHAPSFSEVAFKVNQPKTDITIKMINP